MISFVGYNFLSDLNSVDPYPTNVGIFNQVEIYRAIYDHIDISNDTTITSNIPPTQWDFGTILDCNFHLFTPLYFSSVSLSFSSESHSELRSIS